MAAVWAGQRHVAFVPTRQMKVRVEINKEDFGEICLKQVNSSEKWFVGIIRCGEGGVRVGISQGSLGLKPPEIHVDLRATEGSTRDRDYVRSEIIQGNWFEDWEPIGFEFQTPNRPTFPGEPPLPVSTIKVVVTLVKGVHEIEPEKSKS